MMKLLVAKILCMVGVFFFMLLGALLPVKVIETDFEKAHRSRKILSLCNAFGGGVFLATCFNALLPAVREKLQKVLSLGHISTDYPLAETLVLLGFFLTVFVEQLVLTFRKEKPSFIDLETFNAGSDVGSDSEYESPFMGGGRGHAHGAGLSVRELSRSGPLRLLSLVFALAAHSVFEGLALGLQEEGEKVVSLFVGVAVHETLVAVALGISMARSAMPLRDAAKLAVAVSSMIPLGISIGLGIESARGVPSSVASVLLQGLAGGTFLFVTFLEILARELEDRNDRLLKVLFLVLGYAVLAGMVFLKWVCLGFWQPPIPPGVGKMPEQSNDYRVVVFGAGGVGKSSLVLRFVKGTFRDTYIPTIEDTYRQVISCDKSVCTLQITDTTGSHQFPAMQRLSISKGHAFILVFSVTSKQSLEELGPIYQLIVQIKGSVEDIPVMLVGNKCDETQREVDTREAQALAQQWKCAFMETSAKMNYNVKELFQELLTLETRRNMSLSIDGKHSSKQKRTERIKGKCSLM